MNDTSEKKGAREFKSSGDKLRGTKDESGGRCGNRTSGGG